MNFNFFFKIIIILKSVLQFTFLFSILTTNLFTKELGTRFITLGHLYSIMNDEKKLKKLAEKVNKYKADYIFILGDSGLEDKKILNKYRKLFKSKLFFTPGEQELKKSIKSYEQNVGYLNLYLKKKDVRFLLLNSSTGADKLKNQIELFLKEDFESGPTIILVNHRIWDDTLLSKKPFQHDKSYFFEEIYPSIKGKVNYIFAGNGKRQYFRDIKDDVSYGKQNVNVIHWLDMIGDINAYAIGMGDGNPKAIFTIADVINKKLLVYGNYSTTQIYDILPKN